VLKDLQWPLWLPKTWYNKLCIHRLVNPRNGCASIVISMSMYLFVCLSVRISPELHVRSVPNFWCMLPMVVARSSSGEGGEVCYLRLPCLILWPLYFTFDLKTGSRATRDFGNL